MVLASMCSADLSVTGGLGSVGMALAKTLTSYGADVVLVDLPISPADDVWSKSRYDRKEILIDIRAEILNATVDGT